MKYLLLLTLPFLLISCTTSMVGNSQNEKHQTELALHKARTDIEELKAELNSTSVQLQILENKLKNQQLAFNTLKQENVTPQQTKVHELSTALISLEKQVKEILLEQKETLVDLQNLSNQAGDTKTALSQYKEKIAEVEQIIAKQTKSIEKLSKESVAVAEEPSEGEE